MYGGRPPPPYGLNDRMRSLLAKQEADKYTLRVMARSIVQSPWFTRLLLPVIAAVLIDGLSEALKTFGTFIASNISDDSLLQRMDWEGAFIAMMGITVLAVALYFALRSFAKYESDSLAMRTAVLVLALLLVGTSHMWPVIFDRSLMHDRYGEINPGKTTLRDIDKRFLADWNKNISFHSDSPNDLCTNACSFKFSYPVPKFFGEGNMTLKFDADKKVLQKCWFYDCEPK